MIKTAFILCGGRGLRLRPLIYSIPKVMVPVQGKPILEHNIELMKRHGIKRVVLAVGFMRDSVKKHFGDGSHLGVDITYVEEASPLGTAGPLRLAEKQGKLPKGPFVLANGDELKDIDIAGMHSQHKRTRAMATIALKRVKDPRAYGVARLDGQKILEFVEKPKSVKEAPSNLINAGLYIAEPGIMGFVPEGKAMLEYDVFPKIASEGRLFGFMDSGQWFPTDTPERLSKAKEGWKGLACPDAI